jgi:putative transposase
MRKALKKNKQLRQKADAEYAPGAMVIIAKRLAKAIYTPFWCLSNFSREILHKLSRQCGSEIIEGHLVAEHVHMCLQVPPKYSLASVIGFLKGKCTVRIHRELLNNRRATGKHFWARRYCVSTVGLDEAMIRRYIREQESTDSGQDSLFAEFARFTGKQEQACCRRQLRVPRR